MNLNTSLLRAISLFPDREAVSDDKRKLTYRELGQRVGSLVEFFNSLGLKKGDVVAIMRPIGDIEYEILDIFVP